MSAIVQQVKHPLIMHKLSHMRRQEKDCPPRDFTRLMREVGMLMAYAVTESWSDLLDDAPIITERDGGLEVKRLRKNKPVLTPLLRTGLVMADGMNDVIQTTYIGHVGVHRKQDNTADVYLVTLPDRIEIEKRRFIIVDPVVATGATILAALEILGRFKIPPEHIYLSTIICSIEGIDKIAKKGINIYYAAIDRLEGSKLVPGFGSVSARLFRTA